MRNEGYITAIAGCNFHGGIGTLAKRLGIARQWLPRHEYLRQRREHEEACEAARRLDHAVYTRRMELLQRLELLRDMGRKAHRLGPNRETTWDALEMVYLDRPLVEAELEILESASVAEVAGVLLLRVAA